MIKQIALFLFIPLFSFTQNSISIDRVQLDPSYEHIGVVVHVNGDNNRNANISIQYRPTGTASWLNAAKSMRIYPGMQIDGRTISAYNHFSASAMFLQTASNYEIQITLFDEDGAPGSSIYTATTLGYPSEASIRTKYVQPGNGGGSGTQADPFNGMEAALNTVEAGDLFLLMDGTYSAFALNSSGNASNPIIFKSMNLHQAIIDGDNTDRGIITLGVFNDSIQHILIDGLLIRNGSWAIDAQNTQHVTVKNNSFENVDYAYVNRRDNGWEHHQYITNNKLIGRTSWPQLNGEIPGERGIDLRGNFNTVSYNYISNFGDGISTDGPPYETSYSLDIHNNDITNIVDDGIEVDGIIANARVYQNRVYNSRMGVSVSPVFGGPTYIFRNEFFNLEYSTYKLNRGPSGIVIVHNTGVKLVNGMTSSAGWQNTFVKNNILFATRYCFEEYDLVENSIDDWDNNGYHSTRTSDPWFKWDDVRYADIAAIQASGLLEASSMALGFSDLEDATLPTSYGEGVDPMDRDLNLSASSLALNNGTATIDNMNIPFVSDGMPDRGALEQGAEPPVYGPDFNTTTSVGSLDLLEFQVSPNPFSSSFQISGLENESQYQVLSLEGKVLKQGFLRAGENEIFVFKSLAAGLYLTWIKDLKNGKTGKQLIIKI